MGADTSTFRRFFALVAALLALVWAFPSFVTGVDIPRVRDTIVESDVVGVFSAVEAFPNRSFVAVGYTAVYELCLVPPGLVPCVPRVVNASASQGLIYSYSAAGSRLWSVSFQVDENTTVGDLALDDAIYVVGETGWAPPDNPPYGYVAKYYTNGTRAWLVPIDVPNSFWTILVSVVVAGDSLVISGGTHVLDDAAPQPVLATISKDGTGLVVNVHSASGSVFRGITGSGPTSYYAAGAAGGCMANVTLTSSVWTVCDYTMATALRSVANSAGNAVATGDLNDADGSKAVLANRAPDGTLNWVRYFRPQPSPYVGYGVTTAPNGTTWMTGTNGSVLQPLFATGFTMQLEEGQLYTSIFTNKYTSAGNMLWTVEYGDLAASYVAFGSALDSEPLLLIAGGLVNIAGTDAHGNPMVVRYEGI